MAASSITHLPCTTCKSVKPLSEFHKDKCRRRGYHYTCKPCTAEWTRQYRKSAKVKHRLRKAMNKYHTRLRQEALQILGGKCVRCNFSEDFRALQIDHINGGGNAERSAIGQRAIHRKIITGESEGYQLLCANCNWIKRYEEHEAPWFDDSSSFSS